MKMMKFYHSLAFLILFGANLFGQDPKAEPSIREIRKNNYQVEFGYRSIQNITLNTAAASIIFKKKFSPGKLIDLTSIKFLRAYLTLNANIKFKTDAFPLGDEYYNYYYSNDYLANSDFLRRNTDVSVGFGIEKQFQKRRFVHYFGGDLSVSYYDRKRDYYSNGTGYHYFKTYKTISTGLIPFLGLKYYLTDQLHFGLETGFALSYYHSNISDVSYTYLLLNNDQFVLDNIARRRSFENGIRLNFLGLRFITLGYTF
jgi:hypothetical protein